MERGVRGLGGEAGHAVWQHRVCTHRGGGHIAWHCQHPAQRTHLPCPLQTHAFQLVRRAQVVPEKRHQHRQLPTHTHTRTARTPQTRGHT